jgi:L-threonate 2-dehydrogenase
MQPIVAVIAPGMMGSAVGQRLVENGIEVRTLLAGRSEATIARAKAAGMLGVSDEQAVASDIILSILPPGDALGLAERLAPALRATPKKPVFVDCNALNPGTVLSIAKVIEETGATFVDGGIIGGPPKPGSKGTKIYLSGEAAARVAELTKYGLQMPIQPGPIGAASAMKMSYAGLTKGLTALGCMMILSAKRGGVADSLRAEFERSQPALLGWLQRQIPAMYSKAYRFVGEMEEISDYVGEDVSAEEMFDAFADFYTRLAADYEGPQAEVGALTAFLKPKQ